MTHQTLSLEKYWKLFPATLRQISKHRQGHDFLCLNLRMRLLYLSSSVEELNGVLNGQVKSTVTVHRAHGTRHVHNSIGNICCVYHKHVSYNRATFFFSATFLINCLRTGTAASFAIFISGKAAKTTI